MFPRFFFFSWPFSLFFNRVVLFCISFVFLYFVITCLIMLVLQLPFLFGFYFLDLLNNLCFNVSKNTLSKSVNLCIQVLTEVLM